MSKPEIKTPPMGEVVNAGVTKPTTKPTISKADIKTPPPPKPKNG